MAEIHQPDGGLIVGTKPAPLNYGERMWLRKSAQRGHRGGPCWILAPLVPEGNVRILTDDGSGRPRDEQLADARSVVRIHTVARGQLVAFGTATWFRESRAAHAANRAAAELADTRSAAEVLAGQVDGQRATWAPAEPAG